MADPADRGTELRSEPDPFGINEIRDSILQSWLTSPTRLREDVAAESDLVAVGYRDRLLTELVANAADAATAAGVAGVVQVWLDGGDLHVANTGSPLDAGGAAALTALRSSNKTGSGLVGRFGVGFTAVAAVTRHVQIRSASGSIEFSAERTRRELAARGVEVEQVPTLRLAWPVDSAPAAGFDTEVVLRLQPHVDTEVMMRDFAAEAVELLLELPAVQTISIADHPFTRERAGSVVSVGSQRWLEYAAPHARWLLPMTGEWLVSRQRDVLRAPTRTDVELTVPAICIADVRLTADRRGLHPDADIATAAIGYADFAASLSIDQRTILVPEPGFAASRTDERLRSALVAELASHPWLPGAGGDDLIPERAEVLLDLTPGLSELLGEIITTLVHPDLSDRGAVTRLRSVGVTEIGLADIASRLTGIDREPRWWGRLYTELAVVAQGQVDELGALPVPLTDGRTMPGARGAVLPPPQSDGSGTDVVAPSWLPTVHPQAAHELLGRLGARQLSVSEMLSDPALRGELESDPEGDDLARSVLGLLRAAPDASVPAWLGQVLLPTMDGDERPADELLLPNSPLASVLIDDSPFGVVDPDWVETYGAEAFRALGVGWGFTVTHEEYPTGPDHDLPDEARWWDTIVDPPQTFSAVRDLDLVDRDRWPQALSLLAESPDCAALLTDRDGYTAWWLRHYAEVDEAPLGHWRAPSDDTMAGVLDPLDHPHADELSGALGAADVEDTDQALMFLAHLADAGRTISPSVAAIAHTALAVALRDGRIDLGRVEPPTGLRTLAGSVADDAVVLDVPWLAAALDPAVVVAVAPPGFALATQLADLLDIPTATEEYSGGPTEPGEASTWQAQPQALRSALIQDRPLPTGPIRVHDTLTVELRRGDERSEHRVPWWRDEHGMVHVDAGFDVLGG
ncbi:hypothetical protein [Williamsia sp. 1138]|uniref:sacsin N-terminal ATP-binding-like domain-containing protein n=1 Tax=Williamsia sp. 1138 TaxID=1903117 RepID=UPI000A117AB6|nr:hypothetical protein [Williamsia sp. 1138]